MGQPTHPLTQHSGKSQLWATGPIVLASSLGFGPSVYKVHVVLRLVYLFFLNPTFVPYHNLWQSKLRAYRVTFYKRQVKDQWYPLPDLSAGSLTWHNYFRVHEAELIFKEADTAYTELVTHDKITLNKTAWSQVRILSMRTRILVLLRGVPMFKTQYTSINPQQLNKSEVSIMWQLFVTNNLPTSLVNAHQENLDIEDEPRAPRLWF